MLESGLIVRLPLEVEWEKAACWDQRREVKLRYPWGDEWSSAQANTADGRGDWMLAPVGCYPGGASPYGLHDCTGNGFRIVIGRPPAVFFDDLAS